MRAARSGVAGAHSEHRRSRGCHVCAGFFAAGRRSKSRSVMARATFATCWHFGAELFPFGLFVIVCGIFCRYYCLHRTEEEMFLLWFIGLVIGWKQDYAKSFSLIVVIIYGWVGYGPRTRGLDLGVNRSR